MSADPPEIDVPRYVSNSLTASFFAVFAPLIAKEISVLSCSAVVSRIALRRLPYLAISSSTDCPSSPRALITSSCAAIISSLDAVPASTASANSRYDATRSSNCCPSSTAALPASMVSCLASLILLLNVLMTLTAVVRATTRNPMGFAAIAAVRALNAPERLKVAAVAVPSAVARPIVASV